MEQKTSRKKFETKPHHKKRKQTVMIRQIHVPRAKRRKSFVLKNASKNCRLAESSAKLKRSSKKLISGDFLCVSSLLFAMHAFPSLSMQIFRDSTEILLESLKIAFLCDFHACNMLCFDCLLTSMDFRTRGVRVHAQHCK